MQSHFPTLMAAIMCSAVAHGDAWANARLLVDSRNEHPHLISQTLADTLGLSGPIAGRATQANGEYLPLRDFGDLDLMVSGQVVKQWFLSSQLSHYEIILGEPWLRENSMVMDYVYNVLW